MTFIPFVIHPRPVPPPVVTTQSVEGTEGEPLSQVLEADGGTGHYAWTHVPPLPAGLVLSQAGEVSGTPTVSGKMMVNIDAVDALARPDNEPSGLVPVYPGHPTKPGVVFDGTELYADYRPEGANIGKKLQFGDEWKPPRVRVVPTARGPAIRKSYTPGDKHGWSDAAFTDRDFSAAYKTLYTRLAFEMSENWQRHKSGSDKLLYLGTWRGVTAAFYWMLKKHRITFVNQSNRVGQPAVGGEDIGEWGSDALAKPGEPHTLEVVMQAQSEIGVADGLFRAWLDGDEIKFRANHLTGTGQTGIMWFNPASGARYFSGIEGLLFWGGRGDEKTVNDWIQMGELYITGRAA